MSQGMIVDILLHVGSIPHGLFKTSSGLSKVSLHTSLVLLRLGLVLVDGVNLFSQLRHAVVVLLSKSSKGSLMTNVRLLKIRFEFGQLRLTLLVQLNLEGGVGSSLFKTGSNVLQVTGQESSVLLSLGSVAALNIDLFIKLINTDLEFLDLLGVLGSKGLFILNLGSNGGNLLLLALNGLRQLRVDSLKIRDSLLGELEVTFNLSLHLLSITLGLLLTLKSILTFIKGLFKFSLDLAEMVASSPLIRALVWSTCFCRSFLAFSRRVVLSMISWTADPTDWRARTSSDFSAESLVWISVTAVHSATALSMLASATAILSSYSFLYLPNWVHLRLGLMASQSCIHNQVLAIIIVLMALWQAYRASFWSWSFLNCILDAFPLAPAWSQERTAPILSSRNSSILPRIPALKKTLV